MGGKRPGAGRPPGAVNQIKKDLASMARAHAGEALKALVKIAKDGENEGARVSAATAILDRAYGKPTQSHQHSGPGGAPIQTVDLTHISDAQLETLKSVFGPLAGASGDDDADDPGRGGEA